MTRTDAYNDVMAKFIGVCKADLKTNPRWQSANCDMISNVLVSGNSTVATIHVFENAYKSRNNKRDIKQIATISVGIATNDALAFVMKLKEPIDHTEVPVSIEHGVLVSDAPLDYKEMVRLVVSFVEESMSIE